MKTEEDEAFDEIARKQGMWGGGFMAKKAMAADKLQDGKCKLCVDGCIACDARAQPAQEPVATKNNDGVTLHLGWDDLPVGTKLYTTPPKREWVGLTDDEREGIAKDYSLIGYKSPFKEIEAKLKEKNT